MPQQKNSPNDKMIPKSKTDTPQRQYPGVRGDISQAQEFVNEYDQDQGPYESESAEKEGGVTPSTSPSENRDKARH